MFFRVAVDGLIEEENLSSSDMAFLLGELSWKVAEGRRFAKVNTCGTLVSNKQLLLLMIDDSQCAGGDGTLQWRYVLPQELWQLMSVDVISFVNDWESWSTEFSRADLIKMPGQAFHCQSMAAFLFSVFILRPRVLVAASASNTGE